MLEHARSRRLSCPRCGDRSSYRDRAGHLNPKLTRRCDLVESRDFSVCVESIKGTIRPVGSEDEIPVTFTVTWDAVRGLTVVARRGTVPSETGLDVGESVGIEGVVQSGVLSGWRLSCRKMHVATLTRRSGVRSQGGPAFSVVLLQWDRLALTRQREGTPVRSSELWVPNFLFDGEEETVSRQNAYRLDGFTFTCQGHAMTVRQVDDYRATANRLEEQGGTQAVTSVLRVLSNGGDGASPVTDSTTDDLFWLISGVYGIWIRPSIRCDYDDADELSAISFRLTPRHHYHQKRTFIDCRRTGDGWGTFLEEALPAFCEKAESFGLRQVCNQITESQQRMSLQSQVAIVWICLEHFSTFCLRNGCDRGRDLSETGEGPLMDKLNLVNRDLRFLPKGIRDRMKRDRWLKTIRNPLFHQGHAERSPTALWQVYFDLLTVCVLLLCRVCGYSGRVVIPKVGGQDVLGVSDIA